MIVDYLSKISNLTLILDIKKIFLDSYLYNVDIDEISPTNN